MDIEGARELVRRIGTNAGVAPRPVPGTVSAGALNVYRWFNGDDGAARPIEPQPPAMRPLQRRIRFHDR